jgi:hypothetical protein
MGKKFKYLRMKHYLFTPLIIITLLSSCKNNQKLDCSVIEINADSTEIFEIPASSKIIRLTNDCTDSSLIIGDVYKLEFSRDTIIIFSKDRVIAIDSNGHYLHDFSTKGRGPLEFLNLTSVFIKNGFVNLYDNGSNKILKYYLNGTFCDSIVVPMNKQNLSINRMIPFYGSDRYIFSPVFQGEQFIIPKLGLLDSNYKIIDTLAGEHLKSGISFMNTFSFNGDEVIFWEPFSYSIYSIDSKLNIKQKYYVDFKEYALSSNVLKKPVNEIITLINKKQNRFKFVTSVYDVYETINYVLFRYSLHRQHYLAIYNKHKNLSKSYEITRDGYQFSSFVTVLDEKIYLIANEQKTNNTALFCIDFKDIDR